MRLILLFFLISFSVPMFGQSEIDYRLDSLLFDRADRMGAAFIQKKYDLFADYTYPTILEALGGKDSMVLIVQKSIEQAEREGVQFTSVSFGQHSDFIQTENDLQCILPQELKMSLPGGSLTVLSYLIAITEDNGATWYFLDTTDQTFEVLQKTVPTLSNDLVIPAKEQPIFVKE